MTIIGHSQGALVARRALTSTRGEAIGRPEAIARPEAIGHPGTTGRPGTLGRPGTQLGLVTVSGPFAGIAAANACGSPIVKVISLGLIAPMCRIGTGAKWSDITYSSDFIRNPGSLNAQVARHLKIDTDERESCRRTVDGRCIERDYTFSLDEQRNPVVDADRAAQVVEVKAGHVEIVGDQRVAPVKLIALLQEHGIIKPTERQRLSAFDALLARVYGAR